MNFTTATDRATRLSITLADIAEACGVSPATIHRARMDPENPNARPAPPSWRSCIAQLCRSRANELLKLAERIEG